MKKFKKLLGVCLVATAMIVGASCDNNEEIVVDPNAKFDAVLDVKEAGPANPNVDVAVNANTASTILAKVTFTTTTKDMLRLYITQNIKGAGEIIYKPTEAVDLKADGAIDLTGKNSKNFEFQFALPVPAGLGTTGTVVYSFWTTTGNGDFRDKTKRLALGTGTITLKLGTATNPDAPLKSYTNLELRAPLADGTSLTFMSFFDGKTYKITTGATPAANAEFVALWDMGYYYRTNPNFLWEATLSSTNDYLDAIVNIPTLSGIAKADLNKVYFRKGTTLDFATVTTASLNAITASTEQTVKNLRAGELIEFVDKYGKKGLIKVISVTGTDGTTGVIKVDIKVQP
jgi:hypothetical protein